MYKRSASLYNFDCKEYSTNLDLRKSQSFANCEVEKKSGFKPSDRYDPNKRQILTQLSQQIWQKHNITESSNMTKKIDLEKIFTPATDAEEILPKNRKLYASSAFYSPILHPTVEDQVELARRISHSLSDISNHQSKGQSMYVNRKKRSVKWVHEGSGKVNKDSTLLDYEYEEMSKENSNCYSQQTDASTAATTTTSATGESPLAKLPLKLVMNPRGQIRDFNSVRESLNIETGLMSPEKCAQLVIALNTQKGKGAELFAKRRRKAEKWIVDETNTGIHTPSGLPDYHQYQVKPQSPSIMPAYSDAGKHRVQLNMHQEKMIEKYAKPGLKVVKTPWEAALETGSASAAFVEDHQAPSFSNQATPALSPAAAPWYLDNRSPSPFASSNTSCGHYGDFTAQASKQQILQQTKPSTYNSQRDLAYKPNIPQGWKAPSMTLPKELYVPKEIPLESYAPPPQSNILNKPSAPIDVSQNWWPPQAAYASSSYPSATNTGSTHHGSSYSFVEYSTLKPQSTFPLSKPIAGNYSSTYAPPKQQHLPPNSYQTVQQFTSQAPQVNFNPSPLPYDKLAKFENPPPVEISSPRRGFSQYRTLSVPCSGSRVSNASPVPYGVQSTAGISRGYPSVISSKSSYGNGAASPTYVPLGTLRPSSQLYNSYGEPKINYKTHCTDLLRCQNFNNAARGWGRAKSSPIAPKLVGTTGHLPYTDF